MKDSYKTYEEALELLQMETLEERRTKLSLKFAKKSQKSSHANDLFKHKEKHHPMILRDTDKYEVNNTLTNRYQVSAVPYMQGLLNKHYREEAAQENQP